MRKLLLVFLFIMLLTGCGRRTAEPESSPVQSDGVNGSLGQVEISFTFNHRKGIASNQFAVWIESNTGEYVKTLFTTEFTADGGWKKRPDALAVWVQKSGLSSSEKKTVDAFSGATPKTGGLTYFWDCKDASGQAVPEGDYKFCVEGTIFWTDAVLYTGTVRVGGEENSVQAEAQYTTDAAKESDMITGVAVVFKPQE